MIQQQCFRREDLVNYLQGWTDDSVSQAVESHLTDCQVCESLVVEIESSSHPIANLYQAPLEKHNRASSVAAIAAAEVGNIEETPKEFSSESSSENSLELAAIIDSIKAWNGSPSEAAKVGVGHFTAWPDGDIGNYQVLELIGRGGMAEVYHARHRRLGRDVAIKVLRVPRWQIEESIHRIEREIAAIGRLNHPGIVAAIDAGEQDGNQFLVTEFIDGLDLSKVASAMGQLTVPDACELVRCASIALANAHGLGVIHRDVKPSNIMLDINGTVKVLDFGLVHLDGWNGVAVELTTVGQLLGTLDYMAPEQAEKATNVDHRSDVYALGATLYRLLTGRAPYAASTQQSPLEKLRLLATVQPPKVTTLRPDIPTALGRVIDLCLARNPNDRPTSAAHLAEQLLPFCEAAELATLLAEARQRRSDTQIKEDAMVPSSLALSIAKPKVNAARSGRKFWRYLMGLAMAAAAIGLGIVVTLENSKGQIVIQSETAGIKVNLLKDGKTFQQLEIKPGTTTTRLYSGKYEIEIDSATDGFSIDKSQIILKNGETIVARIDHNTGDGDHDTAKDLVTTQPTVQDSKSNITPLYKGDTYEKWFDQFQRELNIDQKAIALTAMQQFRDQPSRDRTRRIFMQYFTDPATPKETFKLIGYFRRYESLSDGQWQQFTESCLERPLNETTALLGFLVDFPNKDKYFQLVEKLFNERNDWDLQAKESVQTIFRDRFQKSPDAFLENDKERALRILDSPIFDQEFWRTCRLIPDNFPEPRYQQLAIDAAIETLPAQFHDGKRIHDSLLTIGSYGKNLNQTQRIQVMTKIDKLLSAITKDDLKNQELRFEDSFITAILQLHDKRNFKPMVGSHNRPRQDSIFAPLLWIRVKDRKQEHLAERLISTLKFASTGIVDPGLIDQKTALEVPTDGLSRLKKLTTAEIQILLPEIPGTAPAVVQHDIEIKIDGDIETLYARAFVPDTSNQIHQFPGISVPKGTGCLFALDVQINKLGVLPR